MLLNTVAEAIPQDLKLLHLPIERLMPCKDTALECPHLGCVMGIGGGNELRLSPIPEICNHKFTFRNHLVCGARGATTQHPLYGLVRGRDRVCEEISPSTPGIHRHVPFISASSCGGRMYEVNNQPSPSVISACNESLGMLSVLAFHVGCLVSSLITM
jgi:hypothetical protein